MTNGADGLAARLRAETEAVHIEAERSGYIQEILKRRASLEGYALFLGNLLPAYETLERAIRDHADHPALDHFSWPKLFRSEAIRADMSALAGPDFSETLTLLPAGSAYVGRIDEVSALDPVRLIGHAYVRYVGDLSGGQIVKSLLEKAPGLAPEMLQFYDFPDIADAEAYKDGFRLALDQAGSTEAVSDAIVEEALLAFRLNIDLSLSVQQAMAVPDPLG